VPFRKYVLNLSRFQSRRSSGSCYSHSTPKALYFELPELQLGTITTPSSRGFRDRVSEGWLAQGQTYSPHPSHFPEVTLRSLVRLCGGKRWVATRDDWYRTRGWRVAANTMEQTNDEKDDAW